VISTAVVPVGITQFSHLYTGKKMDAAAARALLAHVTKWSDRAKRERGEAWVFGSDELYLNAETALPPEEHYGDFAQIENGVGSITSLLSRVNKGLRRAKKFEGERIGVVTGSAMADLMPPIIEKLAGVTGASFELIVAENSLFGPTITTAGLLVGADILRALESRSDLDFALIPAETINDDSIFLDDHTLEGVRSRIQFPIYPSYDFIDVLETEPTAVAA
jgi:NifB/MoaA-like Fe-S oxidoreductase